MFRFTKIGFSHDELFSFALIESCRFLNHIREILGIDEWMNDVPTTEIKRPTLIVLQGQNGRDVDNPLVQPLLIKDNSEKSINT